jgi:hypothetical protein
MSKRVGYAALGGVLSALIFASVLFALGLSTGCGTDGAIFALGFGTYFLSPVLLVLVVIGSVLGYKLQRKASLALAGLLLLGGGAIGVVQIATHPQPASSCRIDL